MDTDLTCEKPGCAGRAAYRCKTCPGHGRLCERCAIRHGAMCTNARPGSGGNTAAIGSAVKPTDDEDPEGKPSLYDALGGVYNIAMVVNEFSDRIMQDERVGENAILNTYLKDWAKKAPTRLPGLKFQRTLWLCAQAGGPQQYHASTPERTGACPMSLEGAHFDLHIGEPEFRIVKEILQETLLSYDISDWRADAVVAVFGAHMAEVTLGKRHARGVQLRDVSEAERLGVCQRAM